MYVEMYRGIIQLLDRNPDREDLNEMQKLGKIPHYLNLVFGIEPDDVKRVKTLHLEGIPDIIMVLSDMSEDKKTSVYADYIMYEGRICRIVLFNMAMLKDKDDKTMPLYAVGWSVWKIVFTVVENYTYMYERRKNNPSLYSVSNGMYYSSAVLMISVLDKLFGVVDSDMVKDLINLFYTPSITVEGIESIRKLINDIGLEMLLDYNMWCAVDDKTYPGSRFAETDNDDEKEENEDSDDKTDPV